MFIYVEKLLPVFVFPLGLAIALCLVALALSITRRHLAARLVLAIIVAGLWVASMPAFAGLITSALEDQNPARAVADAPAADVIVVLGGGIAGARQQLGEPQLGQAGDRLFEAYALWRAAKGKLILISGGDLPWERRQKPEANVAAEVLKLLGVPGDLILIDDQSRNTHENAVNTALIWRTKGFRSGLLVTSALHMPRALATFRAAGLDVIAWPADFHVQHPLANSLFDFLPDAGALAETTRSAKEWLGLLVYRWRGWA